MREQFRNYEDCDEIGKNGKDHGKRFSRADGETVVGLDLFYGRVNYKRYQKYGDDKRKIFHFFFLFALAKQRSIPTAVETTVESSEGRKIPNASAEE